MHLNVRQKIKPYMMDAIKVRYRIIPALFFGMFWVFPAVLSSSFLVWILCGIVGLSFTFLVVTRPFLIASADGVRYVSLLSDKKFQAISYEEFQERLPSMRWFLRKSDLVILDRAKR